jgi:hypothetical protein
MARVQSLPRSASRRATALPRAPHPSWSGRNGRRAVTSNESARDFWSRLGL